MIRSRRSGQSDRIQGWTSSVTWWCTLQTKSSRLCAVPESYTCPSPPLTRPIKRSQGVGIFQVLTRRNCQIPEGFIHKKLNCFVDRRLFAGIVWILALWGLSETIVHHDVCQFYFDPGSLFICTTHSYFLLSCVVYFIQVLELFIVSRWKMHFALLTADSSSHR